MSESAGSGELTDATELEELRELLLVEERERLDALEGRVVDPSVRAEDVSEVLVSAIRDRQSRDDKLAKALAPTIEGAFKTSIRRNPRDIADAIFPILGPAIRKAISHALSGLVQSFNQALEHSLSPKALKWRLEAMRTGKTFGEVVMLHTLVYRVEELLLIDPESGVLLSHVVSSATVARDADMVSGLLTAIRDYARDSFSGGTERSDSSRRSLDSIEVGDLKVWVAEGSRVVLAAVVFGNPPTQLKGRFQETVEVVESDYGRLLDEFSGDVAPLEAVRPQLEDCLEEAKVESAEKGEKDGLGKSQLALGVLGILLVAVLVVGFVFWRRGHLEQQRWDALVAHLRETPGLIVLHASRVDDGFEISGLRDALATEPESLIAESGLAPGRVRSYWGEHDSLDPSLVLLRVRKELRAPGDVRLELAGRKLTVSGAASEAWREELLRRGVALPGVDEIDASALVSTDREERLLERARRVLEPPASARLSLEGGRVEVSGLASPEWIAEARVLARVVDGVEGIGFTAMARQARDRLEASALPLDGAFEGEGGRAALEAMRVLLACTPRSAEGGVTIELHVQSPDLSGDEPLRRVLDELSVHGIDRRRVDARWEAGSPARIRIRVAG